MTPICKCAAEDGRRNQSERRLSSSKVVMCAKSDTAVIVVYGLVEDEWGVEEEYS